MLVNTLKKAEKAGGAEMPSSKYAKLFGNDEKLRRNVLYACREPFIADAIKQKVINDHRVIQSVRKVDSSVGRIILMLEARLGRKLTRSRAAELVETYTRIVKEREAMEMVQRVLASFHPARVAVAA